MTQGIAFLGAGLYAKETHIPALATLGARALPVKAVYSRSESSSRELAELTSQQLGVTPDIYHDAGGPSANLAALLAREDIIAVNIVLPICQQPEYIEQAFAAGKHVFSAKPIGPSVAESVRLIALYEKEYKSKGLVWRIAENFETEAGYLKVGELIRQGKIGKVAFFNLRAVNYMDKESKWYKTPWRTIPDYQGGFLLDGGVHSTSALRVMLPSDMTHLSSVASLTKDYLLPQDTIQTIIKLADGSHGIFDMTFASPTPSLAQGNRTVIVGSSGWLSVENAKAVDPSTGKEGSVMRITLHIAKEKAGETVEVLDVPIDGVVAGWVGFLNAVAGRGDDGLNSPRGTLIDVAFIEAALNSDGSLLSLQDLIKKASS